MAPNDEHDAPFHVEPTPSGRASADDDQPYKQDQRVFRKVEEEVNRRKVLAAAPSTDEQKQIAESEKFDLILQEAVYISPRIDITDRVIKALADK